MSGREIYEAEGARSMRAEIARLRALVVSLGGDPDASTAVETPAATAAVAKDQQVSRPPVVVQADNLRTMVTQIVAAAGSSEKEADTVASNLVLSNLKGHDSHGVGYLPRYIKGALAGLIKQDAVATVVADTPTMVLLDGGIGFGQSLGAQAMALGIPRALEHGVAVVGIRNSHHLARIGAWAEQCADAGLISVHFTNVAGHDPLVAPHNGTDPRLGTNPFTVGFPGEAPGEHIVLDYATSELALGASFGSLSRKAPTRPHHKLGDRAAKSFQMHYSAR